MSLLMRLMANKLPWRSLRGFTLLQGAGVLIPIFALPVVTRVAEPMGWAQMAIGLSIGGVGAIASNFAWNTLGPPLIASKEAPVARRMYAESVIHRTSIAVFVVPIVIATCSFLTGHIWSIASWMALSTLIMGLNANWYFIAQSDPFGMLVTDVGPRVIGSICSIPLVILSRDANWYGILLLMSSGIGLVVANYRITGQFTVSSKGANRLRPPSREFLPNVLSGVLVSGYTSLAPTAVAVTNGTVGAIATIGAAVRLRSIAQASLSPIVSGIQGWAISHSDQRQRISRQQTAFSLSALSGLIVGTLFAAIGPFLTPALFGPKVAMSYLIAVLIGITISLFMLCASASFHVIAPAGKAKVIAVSTSIASAIGTPLLFWLSSTYGAEGAVVAIMVAELTVALIQVPIALSILRYKIGN